MQGTDSYIRCAEVGKVYGTGDGRLEALRGVNVDVRNGEFVSLLGPSGCGKSTLLLMMGGLETVTTGTIDIDGRRVTAPRREIGMMFQDSTLLPWKTALQNVLFPIQIMRKSAAAYEEQARTLLALVGLSDFEDKKPSQLSGGMRQRVALCRALVHQPEVLLMDEPFSALDAITRDDMGVALLDIWERYKKTAIFVTHSIREAVFLSDRILVMGGRPASIVSDVKIPFARPREFSINETHEFNEICSLLREQIKQSPSTPRRSE
jgi:NitT/TauT family transport system ATP-binding protein